MITKDREIKVTDFKITQIHFQNHKGLLRKIVIPIYSKVHWSIQEWIVNLFEKTLLTLLKNQ